MKDIENLSDISKLALSLCEDLNILYTFGKGFATLDGVPMDELYGDSLTERITDYESVDKSSILFRRSKGTAP